MLYEPVRIGVIGCDGYPQELIKRLWTLPDDGVVTAVMSPIPDSPGAEACRRNGIPVFNDVGAMLEAGGFEVVINATPIHLHAALCRQCLEAGFPVWMEKPPTATVQELLSLTALSESLQLQVAVCFNSLFAHRVREIKAELVAGRYGTVRRVRGLGAWVRDRAYFTRNDWSGKVRLGQSWVLDGSINNPFAHVVCNGLFFAGTDVHRLAEPASVEAELYHANAIESEDTSSMRVITREGVEVLTQLTLAPEKEIAPTTVIETEKAVIRLVDFKTLHIHWRDGRIEERESYRENRVEMFQHLCRAIRTGTGYHCDLRASLPFTVAVNAGFDSGGEVRDIPPAECLTHDWNGSPAAAVSGINDYLLQAHNQGALLSEVGVPWARAGTRQITDGYHTFPVRFQTRQTATIGYE